MTFLAVTFAWAIFRSRDLSSAVEMTTAMMGGHGFALPAHWLASLGESGQWLVQHGLIAAGDNGLVRGATFGWIGGLTLLCWLAPNTQEIMRDYAPALDRTWQSRPADWMPAWRPSAVTALVTLAVGALAILSLNQRSEFLYFQF